MPRTNTNQNQNQEKSNTSTNKIDTSRTLKTLKTLKTLRTLESICIGGAMAGLVGFLSGALYNNEKLSLISAVAGTFSALSAYYISKKLQKYDNTNNPAVKQIIKLDWNFIKGTEQGVLIN